MSKPEVLHTISEEIAPSGQLHFTLDPAPDASLAVVVGGREKCLPDYEVKRDSLPFWTLEFVTQGKGTLDFGGERIEVGAGSVFTYAPTDRHHFTTDPEDPMVKYYVGFTGERAARLLSESQLMPRTAIRTSFPGAILSIFDHLMRNGMDITPMSGKITTVILEYLTLKIAETAMPNDSAGSSAFALYRRCREMIHDQWMDFHSLQEIATLCNIDSTYLCRLFKKYDRQSPYQLLLRLKMNHAAFLLLEGHSVAKVSEELHFSDQFHFSRTFKKLMGISPSYFPRLHGRHKINPLS